MTHKPEPYQTDVGVNVQTHMVTIRRYYPRYRATHYYISERWIMGFINRIYDWLDYGNTHNVNIRPHQFGFIVELRGKS